MKLTWKDVLVGFNDDIEITASDRDGVYVIKINDEVILNATRSEAMITFMGLNKLFGPKMSKQLMKLKPMDGITEQLTGHD